MTVIDEQGQLEKQTAERIVADMPLLDGIDSISVELGEDHTGDPALWLVYHMQPALAASDDWLKRLNVYTNQLGLKIINSGVTRFPYSRLRRSA